MSATLILIAALLAGEPPLRSGQADTVVDDILEQKRYVFCAEDNEFIPWFDDQDWCEVAQSRDYEHCPGYREVCHYEFEGELPDLDFSEGGDVSGKGGAGEGSGKGKANRGARKERDPVEWKLPDLGGFARVLMWLLIIVAAAAVIYAIYRNLVRGKDDEPPPEEAGPPDPGDSLQAERLAARKVIETDVQRLLARADASAAKGQHESAIADLYAALLRRLEGEGLIVVDAWKTNGEHLAALRERPGLRDEVRQIIREVEQVQFGAAQADAERFASVRRQVLGVVMRAVLCLALALGLGTSLACDPKQESIKALAGLGNDPSGSRAVGELLIHYDIAASHRMGELEQLAQTDGAIVLLPGVELTADEWKLLLAWVDDEGGTLVVATGGGLPDELGIRYVPADDARTLLVPANTYDWYYQGLELVAPVAMTLDVDMRRRSTTEDLLIRPDDESYDAQTSSWNFSGKQIYAVSQRRGDNEGRVIVFANGHLWTNAAIANADNGALLVNLLRSRDIDEVEFVDDFTGSGADNPLESMRDSKLWAVFLQILLLLLLLYAAVGIPFTRLRDPHRHTRRAFVEHVKTLGQRYAQSRAARHVATLYSSWALDRLRERLQPGGGHKGLHPLAQAIASRTGRNEGQVMQLLVQAHELAQASAHAASERGGTAELELMRELSRLLAETGAVR